MLMYMLWDLRAILQSIYAICDNQVKDIGISVTSQV